MSEEFKGLPYEGLQRLPLTRNIPYNYRWRILNIKLMLNDLKELDKKHGIQSAHTLYITVQKEAEELCLKLASDITEAHIRVQKWLEAT